MITEAEVTTWAGLTLPENDEVMALVVAATNVYVDALPSIDRTEDGGWAPTTRLGAVMLASRIYRRKNSPAGIEAVGDMTTYVARYDSDISRLLHIDTFRKPVIA